MTFKKIIDYIDTVKPNAYDVATKLHWLFEADSIILCEVHRKKPSELDMALGEQDTPSVPEPYSRLYSYYVFAMMDFFSGDVDGYKLSAEMFDKLTDIYAKWYVRGGEAV